MEDFIVPTSTIHSRLHTPLAVAPVGNTMDERLLHVRQQPDGYHWVDEETGREAGPFEAVEDALADMDGVQEEAIERSETIDEAEQGADRALGPGLRGRFRSSGSRRCQDNRGARS